MGHRHGKERGVGVEGKHCVRPWGQRSCPHKLELQPSRKRGMEEDEGLKSNSLQQLYTYILVGVHERIT